MHLDRVHSLHPTCLTWKWAKTCAKVIHIFGLVYMWKGQTSGAKKDENLLELEAIDADSRSDRRRGRVYRATLAVALSARDRRADAWATDTLRQRLSPKVSRSGEHMSDRHSGAFDGRARDAFVDRFREIELSRLRPSWRQMLGLGSDGGVYQLESIVEIWRHSWHVAWSWAMDAGMPHLLLGDRLVCWPRVFE
jgi:hypothetical protein